MSELKKQYKVLITRLGDFEVSIGQAKAIQTTMHNDPRGMIELEGNLISIQSIDGILLPKDYVIYNMKKRGGWQCKYHHWHERNQQCAHNQVRRTT